jgi:hypothetical protein
MGPDAQEARRPRPPPDRTSIRNAPEERLLEPGMVAPVPPLGAKGQPSSIGCVEQLQQVSQFAHWVSLSDRATERIISSGRSEASAIHVPPGTGHQTAISSSAP